MPIFRIDGVEIEAASYQEAGDKYDRAKREAEAELQQRDAERRSSDVGALSALATLKQSVDMQAMTLSDQQQQLSGLSDGQRLQGQQLAVIEGTVAAIPVVDLAQVNRQHSEMLTAGDRLLNRAAEVQEGLTQLEETLTVSLADATNQLQALAADATATVDGIRALATASLQQTQAEMTAGLAAIKAQVDGLQQPNAIAEIVQEKPEAFVIRTTDGGAYELQLPRGPRGYRGATSTQAVGGGSGAGGSGAGAGGATVDLQLAASVEQVLRFRTKTGNEVPLRGDAGIRFRVTSDADPTKWSSAVLDAAAADLAGDEVFTVGPELVGSGGDLDLAWRVVLDSSGAYPTLRLFATAPEACRLRASISSMTDQL